MRGDSRQHILSFRHIAARSPGRAHPKGWIMNSANASVRVAIYARVSSERQSRDGTINSQLESLRARAGEDHVVLDPELSFVDDGYSGSTLIRPALDRLRDQAAAGAFGRLYVHSPDRLARRYAYQVLLIDELQGCGVDIVFLNRQLGQGPEDDLLLQVQGVVAEYERAKILERSRRGKQHAARRGSVSVLAHAPYGYRYITRQMAGGEARLNVQFDEARVVADMFRWAAIERMSLSQVARRLKELKIPSPKGRDYWDRGTVFGILRNPCYKGLAAFGKRRIVARQPRLRPLRNQPDQPRRAVSWQRVPHEQCIPIPVPAIVDVAVFDAVQEQLMENRKRHRRACADAKYLLQGLVVCKRCGFAMCGARNEDRLYYRCIGNKATRMTDMHVCQSRSIRGEPLEAAVWDDVQSLLADPQRIEVEYQRRLNLSVERGQSSDKETLQKQANQTRRQIVRLIDAYGDGLIDKAEFEPRIRAARDHLAKLDAEANSRMGEEHQIQELRLVIGHLLAFAQRVREGLNGVTAEDRREIIQALVRRIEVDAEEVKIVYRVDCCPFAQAPERGKMQDCGRRASRAVSSAWTEGD
jgi:site-specific DNA recombinase